MAQQRRTWRGPKWVGTAMFGVLLFLTWASGWVSVHGGREPITWSFQATITWVCCTPLAFVGIATAAFWYLDRPLPPPGHCQKCGYDLTGNVSGRCPECGTVINAPSEP